MINLANPYTEIVGIVGMRQTGKTNLLAYLLWNMPNIKYICIDSLGVLLKANFKPRNPQIQEIYKPRWNTKQKEILAKIREIWRKGNYIIAIDEINLYQTKWVLPLELDMLVSLGGNRNISLIWTSRRIAETHNNIVANTTHHFIFRTFLPTDVDWYAQFIPKSVILMSKNLPAYHFIYYRVGSEPIICKPIMKII